MVVLFVADGWLVVECGVASLVVVPVEEAHDLGAGVGVDAEAVLVEQFALERREERLGHGIVVAISD